jgi:hypothetical protein
MNFGELQIKEGDKTPSSTKVNFAELTGIEKETSKKKVSAEELKRRHDIEPGNKIPVMNYQQVGQFCDICEDVTGHVCNIEKKLIQCQICKTRKTYGR